MQSAWLINGLLLQFLPEVYSTSWVTVGRWWYLRPLWLWVAFCEIENVFTHPSPGTRIHLYTVHPWSCWLYSGLHQLQPSLLIVATRKSPYLVNRVLPGPCLKKPAFFRLLVPINVLLVECRQKKSGTPGKLVNCIYIHSSCMWKFLWNDVIYIACPSSLQLASNLIYNFTSGYNITRYKLPSGTR